MPFVVTFHALGKVRRCTKALRTRSLAEREDIEATVVNEADQVIAERLQDEHDLVRLYGADPRRITIVPCGYDPDEFHRDGAARRRLGLDPRERIILQLGRMVRKGIDTVIEASLRLERFHDVRARL